MVYLDQSEPLEAPHTGDDARRRECPECGARVLDLGGHRRRQHGARARAQRSDAGTPRPETRRPRPDARPAPSGAKLPSLVVELTATYTIAGQIWAMKDPICGGTLVEMAPGLAETWNTAAQSNPTLHRYLSTFMASGSLMAVAVAHLPLAVVVVSHHGRVSEEYLVAPPEWAGDPTVEAPTVAEPAADPYAYTGPLPPSP
jgi:hypothetical protein